jgi:hypothetical protein
LLTTIGTDTDKDEAMSDIEERARLEQEEKACLEEESFDLFIRSLEKARKDQQEEKARMEQEEKEKAHKNQEEKARLEEEEFERYVRGLYKNWHELFQIPGKPNNERLGIFTHQAKYFKESGDQNWAQRVLESPCSASTKEELDVARGKYVTWAISHKKTASDDRFTIYFTKMIQGKSVDNEYADLGLDEFQRMNVNKRKGDRYHNDVQGKEDGRFDGEEEGGRFDGEEE